MNWIAHDIETQPFLFEEIMSESRNLNGHRVFRRVTTAFRRREILQISTDSSVDSQAPAPVRPRNWKRLTAAERTAWGERADLLNDRPSHGTIEDAWVVLDIPKRQQTLKTTRAFLKEDISVDLIRVRRKFYRFIRVGQRIFFPENFSLGIRSNQGENYAF